MSRMPKAYNHLERPHKGHNLKGSNRREAGVHLLEKKENNIQRGSGRHASCE